MYKIDKDLCISCGNCAEICNSEAIDIERVEVKAKGRYMQYVIDQDKCIGCGACQKNCLNEAIYKIDN